MSPALTSARRDLILAAADVGAAYLATLDVKAGGASRDVTEARRLIATARRLAGVTSDAGSRTAAEKREILLALIGYASRRMRADAEALQRKLIAGEKTLAGAAAAKVKTWRDRAAKFLRRVFLAGALILTDPMTADDAKTLAAATAVQVEYLDGFAGAVVAETQGHETTGLPSRAESYGSSVWQIAEAVARTHAGGDGATECLRVLGAADHCAVCPAEAAKGWVPLSELVPVGQTPCGNFCRCTVTYR